MSCCGRGASLKRAWRDTRLRAGAVIRPSAPAAAILFEYTGTGAITITGPMTGTTYRFGDNASRVMVHGADAPSLVGIPGLKPVR
jgi:hypothetical protein